MSLQTKSLGSPIDRSRDGLRILAARYRGRGVPSSRYDVWMANLGPSERLLADYQAGRVTAARFRALYRQELLGTADQDPDNPVIRNRGQKFTLRLLKRLSQTMPVTLMCHCPEEARYCHRHLLREFILKA